MERQQAQDHTWSCEAATLHYSFYHLMTFQPSIIVTEINSNNNNNSHATVEKWQEDEMRTNSYQLEIKYSTGCMKNIFLNDSEEIGETHSYTTL